MLGGLRRRCEAVRQRLLDDRAQIIDLEWLRR
jgi:hypothetical protein